MSDIVQIFGRFQISFQNTVQALYNTPHYNTDLDNNTVMLWLPKCYSKLSVINGLYCTVLKVAGYIRLKLVCIALLVVSQISNLTGLQ